MSGAAVRISGLATMAATGRNGRASLPVPADGLRLLTVEGSAASATDTDRLASVSLAVRMPDSGEVPFAICLPDLSGSAALTLTTGVLPAPATLDDAATSGAILDFAAGTTVGFGVGSVTVRSGGLRARHLPGDLPPAAAAARLPGAAVSIDPAGVTFAPGAALSLPNDLALPANASVELFRLDPVSGTWSIAGVGVVDGSGARIAAPAGAVAGGGLFCFALAVATTATVTGRVVDVQGKPLAGVLVRAAHAHTRTDNLGRFILTPLAAVDGAGAAHTLTIEFTGGRDLRPNTATTVLTLVPGAQDLGDILLESEPVTRVRSLLVTRGALDVRRRMRVSSSEGLGAGIAVGDDDGQATFDEVRAGVFTGMLTTRVKDAIRVFRAEGVQFLPLGRGEIDFSVFGREEDFVSNRERNGGTNTIVVDADGTGPIRFASVVKDNVPGEGFVGLTTERGSVGVGYGSGPGAQATASFASGNTGRTVRSAFSIVDLDSSRTELPLQRVQPRPLGAFDRHALVVGALTGSAGAGKTRRLRSTRRITLEDWFEAVFEGRDSIGAMPRKIDPELTGAVEFAIGVPDPLGNLAAVEGTIAGPGLVIERVGLAPALSPIAGSVSARDLALDLSADTVFALDGALTGLDASIAPSALTFDYGIELAGGEIVDVVRGAAGLTAAGANASLTLPALTGQLQGARHLLALTGSSSVGGATRRQQAFVPLAAPSGASIVHLDVPEILLPAPGATVAANGFLVQWRVPPGATYVVVQLRSESLTEVRDWTAVVPAIYDSYRFRELPAEAFAVLGAGLTWSLSVRAERVGSGPLAGVVDAYRRVVQNWVGISAAERQVDAFSSMAITVTTQ